MLLKDPITKQDFKLDTFVEIDSYDNIDSSILSSAIELCDKYENMVSMYKEGSELWNINHNITTEVSHELGQIINDALYYSSLSDGHFQITIGSVSQLWDFKSDSPSVPDSSDIQNNLQYVDDSKISLTLKDENDPESSWIISKPEGTVIDLGAVSKGYIADRIKDYLIDNNVEHAIINLGGNVLCVGENGDKPFKIAIRDPREDSNSSSTASILNIDNSSVVSSGITERYFIDENGNYYHHILNPDTGYSYDNNLLQVTILSSDSMTGDCLSTVTFTLGLEKGMELVENTEGVEAIFITKDGQLHYSSGAQSYVR